MAYGILPGDGCAGAGCAPIFILVILFAGNSLTKLPSIAGVEICLYTLYYEVFRAGGIEKVELGSARARAFKPVTFF